MHLCIAGSIRAMPEKEKPPAMPVDIYYNDGSDTNRYFYQVQGIFMFTEGFPKELNNACLHTVSKISNKTVKKRAYTRMASYWACYYKYRYPEFKYYVGRKLFEECFSPQTDFNKL